MKRKSVLIVVLCYLIWGSLPVYWRLLSGVDSIFILCCRVVLSLVFAAAVLALTGRLGALRETLKNGPAMRWLLPAALCIGVNWWAYIYAVTSGRVLDSSLGYFMNPLVVFLFGSVIFRERSGMLQKAAVVLALIGVVISIAAYGSFPYIALLIAVSFAAYGVCKKKAGAEPVVGIAVESLVLTPFALAFALLFRMDSLTSLSTAEALILLPVGIVSSVPLILYSKGVNEVPLVVVGFLQYISPSIMLIYGLLIGEAMTPERLVSFAFIGAGLVLYSLGIILSLRRRSGQAGEPQG